MDKRSRKHYVGAAIALVLALAFMGVLWVVIDRGNTTATIATAVLIVLCTLGFVVELMLAATAKPMKPPVLKTAEMRTPGELRK